jgi:hypothetical protein
MYDEWKPLRTGFYAFLEYVHTTIGPFPGEGWSIDRINNDVGYFPGNIRWLPTKENILYGASIGGSLGGKTGWHHTTEAKAKIAAASRERLSSPEQRAKMSERALGEKNGFYGKTHSSETRAKISAAHKKRAQLKEKRIINCEWCRNEFHPRGKTARFCSYRCRNMWMISVQVKQICSCGRQIVPGAMKRHRNASGHDLDKDSP